MQLVLTRRAQRLGREIDQARRKRSAAHSPSVCSQDRR